METLKENEVEAVKEMRKQIFNAIELIQRQCQAQCIAKNTDTVPIVYLNNCVASFKQAFSEAITQQLQPTPDQEKLIAMDQEDFPTSSNGN